MQTSDRHIKATPKPLSAGVGCLILIGGGVLLLIAASVYEEYQRSVPNSDSQRQDAWLMAQHFIKERLKSPGTASFGGISDFQSYTDHVTSLGNQAYAVHGWVDSQNGFGALIRADFSLEEEYVGNDKWRLRAEPIITKH